MADLNLMGNVSNATSSQTDLSLTSSVNSSERADEIKRQRLETIEKQQEEKEEKRQERIQNLVSISEDGDTVQVNAGKTPIFEESGVGRVILKENFLHFTSPASQTIQSAPQSSAQVLHIESAISPRDESDNERTSLADSGEQKKSVYGEDEEDELGAKILSFAGYSDSEVEQLYLDGDISKHEYDKEMASREEEETELENKIKRFARELSTESGISEKVDRDESELRLLFSSDSSGTMDYMDRMKIIQAVEDVPDKDEKKWEMDDRRDGLKIVMS